MKYKTKDGTWHTVSGIKGESAYESAVIGGWKDTESNFYKKLAKIATTDDTNQLSEEIVESDASVKVAIEDLKQEVDGRVKKGYLEGSAPCIISDSEGGYIKNMTIEGYTYQASGTDDDGVAYPNPDNPQSIEIANDVTVDVCGKNLIDYTSLSTSKSGLTCTANDDGTLTINGTAKSSPTLLYLTYNTTKYIQDGETVTTSLNIVSGTATIGNTSGSKNNGLRLIAPSNTSDYNTTLLKLVDSDGNFVSSSTTQTLKSGRNGTERVELRFYNGDTFDNWTIQLQIEKGSTATDFEAPNLQSVTIADCDLCKIGDYADTLDVASGKITHVLNPDIVNDTTVDVITNVADYVLDTPTTKDIDTTKLVALQQLLLSSEKNNVFIYDNNGNNLGNSFLYSADIWKALNECRTADGLATIDVKRLDTVLDNALIDSAWNNINSAYAMLLTDLTTS